MKVTGAIEKMPIGDASRLTVTLDLTVDGRVRVIVCEDGQAPRWTMGSSELRSIQFVVIARSLGGWLGGEGGDAIAPATSSLRRVSIIPDRGAEPKGGLPRFWRPVGSPNKEKHEINRQRSAF